MSSSFKSAFSSTSSGSRFSQTADTTHTKARKIANTVVNPKALKADQQLTTKGRRSKSREEKEEEELSHTVLALQAKSPENTDFQILHFCIEFNLSSCPSVPKSSCLYVLEFPFWRMIAKPT